MGRAEPVAAGGGGDGTGKMSWPEVVGWSVQRVAAQIIGDRPESPRCIQARSGRRATTPGASLSSPTKLESL
uniref:Uncharacterized protein n=1 Tax=Aegilops tauschii TaxID=37682 RepID=M8AXG5_AEGTA